MPYRKTTKPVDDAPGDTETEGHARRSGKGQPPAEAETEGHARRMLRNKPEAEAETEGHARKP